MKTIMAINDTLWLITAIMCVFCEHPALTAIVVITTIVYGVDLWTKFRDMGYSVAPFIKTYWLDILFLIPICKLFRGFRILKVGRMLRVADATCDFAEIAFRAKNALHKKPGPEHL